MIGVSIENSRGYLMLRQIRRKEFYNHFYIEEKGAKKYMKLDE